MYATGSVASFAALKTAIETYLSANGWTLASGVLSRGALYFQLVADTYELRLHAGTGQSGAALTGACSAAVKIMDFANAPMTWPVDYEIHAFADPDEVYVEVRYNIDRSQRLNFGRSSVPGIGGTGAWFTGSFRSTVLRDSAQCRVYLDNGGGGGNETGAQTYDGFGLGLFFCGSEGTHQSSFVHCGLEGVGWKTGYAGAAGDLLGPSHVAALLYALPSQHNDGTPLLPIRAVLARSAQGQTIVVIPQNARYCRLDNVEVPTLTYGSDVWKLYPMHARNDQQRDGVAWSTGAQHSGTYGVAIRYTGS